VAFFLAKRDYDEGMEPHEIKYLAERLLGGELALEQFVDHLLGPQIADLGEAQVDLDRPRRCGFPEVVFAEGKSVAAMEKIFAAQMAHGADVLATRMSAQQAAELAARFPTARYNPVGRTFRIPSAAATSGRAAGARQADARAAGQGRVTIVTAGTSDLPVAEEARETALWTGAAVTMIQDVGVAGPHRLAAKVKFLEGADAVVVVAGMEGALPSVVGGYVACPVIAVPTSVGYGASFGGVAALLGMLNSCASNVTVVNIDAGFKGGYVAGLIAKNAARGRAAVGEIAN
jgi:NCAIR mutase (PurE)-related protein